MNKKNNSSVRQGVIVIEGHVQGLANTRALGMAGIPVIVIDKDNCIARYSKYCKGFFYCPDYKTDEFAQFLIDIAKREQLRDWVLLPSNDHAVYTISRFKSELEQYYKIISPDLPILDKIYKKHNLLEIANRIGVPIPSTKYPENVDEINSISFRFPVMIKGREGLTFYKTTGKKVFIAEDKPALNYIFKQLKGKINIQETFIQEIIPTDETNKTISFTAFCINGVIKSHWTGIKLREHPPKFGTSTFSESIRNDEVLELSEKLLAELNYTGVCEVEFLQDKRDNQYKLIEINARTWLWVGLAISCGVNYPLMVYNYLNNIETTYPKEYIVGTKWINLITDSVYSFHGLLKGKISPVKYIKSLMGRKVFAVYFKKDLRPFFMFIIMLPYLATKR